VVMISGHASIETAVRATKLGAFDFVEKPLSLEKIVVVVRNALEYLRLEDENRRLRAQLEERHQILGASVPMKALRQQIALTAPTNGRVLIYGESGTGKELVARALHANSPRSSMPFVEVNCAAIPEELIESEMFGHRKGSFTGASEDKIGKFQKADGGTLFLDEVGDMPLDMQAKLLRVLQEREIERVGGQETIKVDVRVVAATNRDLGAAATKGEFRLDLFDRLNVLPLVVPPLRARREDIPLLGEHFLRAAAAANNRPGVKLSPDAVTALGRHSYPGNVRELKNLVERLVILTPDDVITGEDVERSLGTAGSPAAAGLYRPGVPFRVLAEEAERTILEEALASHGGQMAATARALELERSHLYKKARALGIRGQKEEEREE